MMLTDNCYEELDVIRDQPFTFQSHESTIDWMSLLLMFARIIYMLSIVVWCCVCLLL